MGQCGIISGDLVVGWWSLVSCGGMTVRSVLWMDSGQKCLIEGGGQKCPA